MSTPGSAAPTGAHASNRSPSLTSLPFKMAKKLLPGRLVSAGALHTMADSKLLPPRDSAMCARRNVDRKSTRLNSSHVSISYAVFCLKKKKKKQYEIQLPK